MGVRLAARFAGIAAAPGATVAARLHATIKERSRVPHVRDLADGRVMAPDHEQARRDLIADISHDLRTPLVAMRGYLELLVAGGDGLSAEGAKRYAAIALRQCEHLARLVDDLFELAKLDYRGLVLDCESFAI